MNVAPGQLDLIILFCLMMADVRVFSGSSVASFTLLELFTWVYCAPVVVSCLWIHGMHLPAPSQRFVFPICLYMAWLLVASVSAIVFRGDASVLQNTKNILPALVIVAFLLIRVRDIKPVVLLCNLYIVYCLLACVVAMSQYKFGGPYLRELVEGTEYKLDVDGALVTNPVVGFSGHPNQFAAEILPAAVLSLFRLVAEIRDGWRIRPITIGVIAILLAGLALSQARAEVIFTCAGSAFVLSPLGRTRSFPLKLAWIGGLILVILLYNFHKLETGDSPGAVTVETRFQLWQTALAAMMSDGYIPLLGNGTDFMTKWSPQIAGWEFPDSHNVWIDQAVFFGLPALVFYLAIWRKFFQTVEIAPARRSTVERSLLDGLRATMIALMGDYFFAAYANDIAPVSQLFFMMSLAVCVVSFGGEEAERRSAPRAATRYPVRA